MTRPPRSTPTAEWLEHQIGVWAYPYVLRTDQIHQLAAHILGNWLQVESLEVEMLVRAARDVKIVSDGVVGLQALANALAPFKKNP